MLEKINRGDNTNRSWVHGGGQCVVRERSEAVNDVEPPQKHEMMKTQFGCQSRSVDLSLCG